MIKLMVAVHRHPDLSPEAFHDYWRSHHAKRVRDCPAAARYIRRYVQCHTVPAEYAAGPVPFDGVVELWFDSVADKEAFFSDPDYLATVQPDEARFADMSRTVFFVTEEELILDSTGGG